MSEKPEKISASRGCEGRGSSSRYEKYLTQKRLENKVWTKARCKLTACSFFTTTTFSQQQQQQEEEEEKEEEEEEQEQEQEQE